MPGLSRMYCILAFLGLLSGWLMLAGCSGAASGLASAPAITGDVGKVSMRIAWPAATTSSRMIPEAATRIEMKVTGPGIATPITGSITRPADTLTLSVPVGVNRVVELLSYDATDTLLSYGKKDSLMVGAGVTTPVTITMGDMADFGSGGIPITLVGGVGSATAMIDARDGGRSEDYFSFDAQAGMGYTVIFEPLEAQSNSGYFSLYVPGGISDVEGFWNSTLGNYQKIVNVSSAPSAGEISFRVYAHDGIEILRYKVTVTEGGEGSIDAVGR
ncbi:MAG: hypothetical protein BWY76_02488 [bacterium ADurb.Bin429]|nr:MAG: hypothetical protein BWY76_02488 [bacterium ADurb.Bin429]